MPPSEAVPATGAALGGARTIARHVTHLVAAAQLALSKLQVDTLQVVEQVLLDY